MKFKYHKLPAGLRGDVPEPIIPIDLPSNKLNTDFRILFLVDSGADYCLLPADLVGEEILGLNIKAGKKLEPGISGISGQALETYLCLVEFKVGGWKYKKEFAFAYGFKMPYGILGRKGFFDLFKKVCFNQDKQEISVTFRKK